MKVVRHLALLAALVFACATGAFAASTDTVMVPKIASFDFVVDYSGSMAMTHSGTGQEKMDMAKEILRGINSKIPDLGYKGGLHTFAPTTQIIPVETWNRASYAKGINTLKTDYDIFGRLTPMSSGLEKFAPLAQSMPRKAAIILVTDGMANVGGSPLDAARAIASMKDVCIHIISLADTAEGQATLDAIAKLNPCTVSVRGVDLLTNTAAMDKFVRDVFYDYEKAAPVEDVIVLRNVNFAFDSYKLDHTAMTILDEVGTIIKTRPGKKVLIAGHTDGVGTDAYNMTLSKKRAEAVRHYLIEMGIEPSRLDAVGYGKSHPKYTNDTAEGRRLNRRVEISFF